MCAGGPSCDSSGPASLWCLSHQREMPEKKLAGREARCWSCSRENEKLMFGDQLLSLLVSSGDAWGVSLGSSLETSSSAVRVENLGVLRDMD